MAKTPSDAPVLFDVECDNSTIKERKDGSYKLVMKDIERVYWETDTTEPTMVITTKKYAQNHDNYYGENAEAEAYEMFTLVDETKEKCKFTIAHVKYKKKSNNFTLS